MSSICGNSESDLRRAFFSHGGNWLILCGAYRTFTSGGMTLRKRGSFHNRSVGCDEELIIVWPGVMKAPCPCTHTYKHRYGPKKEHMPSNYIHCYASIEVFSWNSFSGRI